MLKMPIKNWVWVLLESCFLRLFKGTLTRDESRNILQDYFLRIKDNLGSETNNNNNHESLIEPK